MAVMGLLLLAAAADSSAGAGMTLQQRFDAATSAWQADKCADAVAAFEAMEKDGAIKPGSLVGAAVAVRKGMCLARLDRPSESEASIRAGLPRLGQAGADFRDEVHDATVMLGQIALQRWDYATAADRFKEALAGPARPDRARLLVSFARAKVFDPGPEALAALDEAEAIIREKAPTDRDSLAAIQTIRGRALLNQGRNTEGYEALKQALKLSGGLTLKTTLTEASMRGDLAQAALLNGDDDEARKYLAYTGAGRIAQSPFSTPVFMAAPDCGDVTGLKPDDVAIVEFGIDDSGLVSGAETVYTRSGPDVAAAFAQAVSGWRWNPEKLSDIPAFYKAATRVEMRCSLSQAGPAIISAIKGPTNEWIESVIGNQYQEARDLRQALTNLSALASASAAKGDYKGEAAALTVMLMYPLTDADYVRLSDRFLSLAPKANPPAAAMLFVRVARARAVKDKRMGARTALLSLLDDPATAADPVAANTIRLLAATEDRYPGAKRDYDLIALAATDTRLEPTHPLRQRALLEMANRAAATGDIAQAQSYFTQTGLTEQQCALIGLTPALKRTGASAADYPMEALRMGFEGWVNVQFDIQADGKPASARAIIAYPPLIFVPAAQRMAGDIRYKASYRPEGSAACTGNSERFMFALRKP